MPDVSKVLAQRGKRYGNFEDHAKVAQQLKAVMRNHMGADKWNGMAPHQQESIEMICHKLGRIANGDPNYADNFVDIAGYAKLSADLLEG